MNYKKQLLSAAFLVTGLAAYVPSVFAYDSDELNPKEVYSPIQRVFVPSGFDSNDVSEVVLKGEFENSCFKVSKVSSKIDEENKIITITSKALRYESALCATVMVDFTQPVKIGVVKPGEYTIKINPDSQRALESSIVIKEAIESSPDDFLYASTASANLVTDLARRKQEVIIRGYYPLAFIGCFRISEVRTHYTDDVLVVQPIMQDYGNDSAECEKPNEFEHSILLDQFVQNALMHVRVLNGESINAYIPTLEN